jgi:hypothetical protein
MQADAGPMGAADLADDGQAQAGALHATPECSDRRPATPARCQQPLEYEGPGLAFCNRD